MTPKLVGCCTKCDKEVFEIVEREPETRAPKRVGKILDDAVRVTFLLVSGSQMDLTFCTHCAERLEPAEYPNLWQRVMLSWIAQSGADHPWPRSQTGNGILALRHKQLWKEVA